MVKQNHEQDELEQNGELVFSAYVGERNGTYSDDVYRHNGGALPQIRIYDVRDGYVYVEEGPDKRYLDDGIAPTSVVQEFLEEKSEKNEYTTIGGVITVDINDVYNDGEIL